MNASVSRLLAILFIGGRDEPGHDAGRDLLETDIDASGGQRQLQTCVAGAGPDFDTVAVGHVDSAGASTRRGRRGRCAVGALDVFHVTQVVDLADRAVAAAPDRAELEAIDPERVPPAVKGERPATPFDAEDERHLAAAE